MARCDAPSFARSGVGRGGGVEGGRERGKKRWGTEKGEGGGGAIIHEYVGRPGRQIVILAFFVAGTCTYVCI